MVLHARVCGRVGRCPINQESPDREIGAFRLGFSVNHHCGQYGTFARPFPFYVSGLLSVPLMVAMASRISCSRLPHLPDAIIKSTVLVNVGGRGGVGKGLRRFRSWS